MLLSNSVGLTVDGTFRYKPLVMSTRTYMQVFYLDTKRLHKGVGERQIQHEAKWSAIISLETTPECNISSSARAYAVF